MSYSDDVLLAVAKELFISKAVPVCPDNHPQTREHYKVILGQVADDFSCFVGRLREKLQADTQS